MCLDVSRGKFSLIVNDTMEELHDRVRKRDIKRGLEKLMELYFDVNPSSEAQVKKPRNIKPFISQEFQKSKFNKKKKIEILFSKILKTSGTMQKYCQRTAKDAVHVVNCLL